MIYKFDTSEFISLIAASISLVVLAYIWINGEKYGLHSKISARLMLLIFLFIFLNRLFTNVEALFYKEIFNLLEHLSSLAAGFVAIIFVWIGDRK